LISTIITLYKHIYEKRKSLKTTLSLLTILSILSPLMAEGSLADAIEGIAHEGQLRLGAVQSKDEQGKKSTTLSAGGYVSLSTKPLGGFSLTGTLFTTNPIFGKKEERMFLGSDAEGYSIVGEAYLKANLGKTLFKAGRQLLDTPYADSDDIGMIPNTFEGYSLVNQDIADTTVVLAYLDKWAGVDAPTPEKFNEIQNSGDAVFTAGLIYEGVEQTTLQAWHYKLDDANFNYVEAGYEADTFNMAFQYTDQDHSNSAYGLALGGEVDGLALSFAYNKVDGMVANGFGGGPFFTSAEDHTIAEVADQEAMSYGAEYALGSVTLGVNHTNLDKGEDETDYLASFAVNDKHSLDLIYSDMYDDGSMLRFFANYNF
jgi:hypothetical protein